MNTTIRSRNPLASKNGFDESGGNTGNLFPARCDNRFMRSAFTRAAVLGCVCVFTSLAQQQLTVDKLVEFITSSISQKNQDKEVAGFLATIKLTAKLDPRIVEDLQGRAPGRKPSRR